MKTRLAKTVGDNKGRQIYQKLVDYTIVTAKKINAEKQIWYSSFVVNDDGYTGADFKKKLQLGDDLGQRMENAFNEGFDEDFVKLVIIGSNTTSIQKKS